MNEHITDRVRLACFLFCVLPVIWGCGRERGIATPKNGKVVQAGIGLPDCYLGIPIKELGNDWQASNEKDLDHEFLKTYLENTKAGLSIAHDDTKITGILVYFGSPEQGQFSGQIEGGIGATSTIEDVIHACGQPEQIAVTKNDEGENVDLWYMDKGIAFVFLNKELQHVSVSRRLNDAPDEFKKDIGDTTIYRAIKP